MQVVPHAPQLPVEVWRFAQEPPQQVCPEGQGELAEQPATHDPARQMRPAPQWASVEQSPHSRVVRSQWGVKAKQLESSRHPCAQAPQAVQYSKVVQSSFDAQPVAQVRRGVQIRRPLLPQSSLAMHSTQRPREGSQWGPAPSKRQSLSRAQGSPTSGGPASTGGGPPSGAGVSVGDVTSGEPVSVGVTGTSVVIGTSIEGGTSGVTGRSGVTGTSGVTRTSGVTGTSGVIGTSVASVVEVASGVGVEGCGEPQPCAAIRASAAA
ncbi:MAG: hypothetical protein R3A52_18610 [Polyangiales bacterium]